ncbi:MAG: hypothetical protein WCL32_16235 [Planctomycetota bacterium]
MTKTIAFDCEHIRRFASSCPPWSQCAGDEDNGYKALGISKLEDVKMAVSRRIRQRAKRRLSRLKPSDAAGMSRLMPWAGEPFRTRWRDPTRSDLRKLAAAVRRGWLDNASDDCRQTIVDLTMGVIDGPRNTRHLVAAAAVFIAATARDLEIEIAETSRHNFNASADIGK